MGDMDAATAHLVFVDDDLPGIRRRRAGGGWAYLDPDGKRITDPAERQRLNAIGLPPAYRDAWFCPMTNGHIQATGYDDKGRKQYRYHPDFRTAREGVKFDGCARFGALLPLIRKRVERDLASTVITRDTSIASVVRLLDLGVIRVGNEAYAQANKSFGATTLRTRHVAVQGQTLKLRFKAKSGVLRDMAVNDRALARMVRRLQDLPGQRLFRYVDGDNEYHDVNSGDVNEYLRETMGEPFTAKNFRTWHGSVAAFRLLATASEPLGIKGLTQDVARILGNTPAVTRKSYIHPMIFALLPEQESWRATLALPRPTKWLSAYERGFIELLKDAPGAHELLAAA